MQPLVHGDAQPRVQGGRSALEVEAVLGRHEDGGNLEAEIERVLDCLGGHAELDVAVLGLHVHPAARQVGHVLRRARVAGAAPVGTVAPPARGADRVRRACLARRRGGAKARRKLGARGLLHSTTSA
eukprot:scaffold8936_cov61-Phaeocystis_antarctica.AAC.8